MFQSYISSQQQGHHTALPDNSQLFLKQFLYLRNKRSAGRSGLRDPSWKMSSLSSLHSLTGDARGVSATLSTAGTSAIPIPAKAQPDPARCFHTRSLNHSPKRRLEMALWGTIFSILTQLLPEIRFVKRIFFFLLSVASSLETGGSACAFLFLTACPVWVIACFLPIIFQIKLYG